LRKFVAVTTFHQSGLAEYGQKFIDSFIKNIPIELMVYAENCVPYVHANNTNKIHVYDLHTESPELVAFKRKYLSDPRANGQGPKADRPDATKKFKWDAIRFSHKVYAIFAAAKRTDADVLIWMDADIFCHSNMPRNFLNTFIPEETDIGFLGRTGKYSECGFYSMNLRSPAVQEFLTKFQKMWDDAENGIFTLTEWHDSYVFDVVRKSMTLKECNWSEQLVDIRPNPKNSKGEGHPLINCELGAYLDHLKGDRKSAGKSYRADLAVTRKELYWAGMK
jgi:hypothetical protein